MPPFDFRINKDWLAEHRRRYPTELRGWGKWGDPEGFGSKASVAVEGEDEGEDDDDGSEVEGEVEGGGSNGQNEGEEEVDN